MKRLTYLLFLVLLSIGTNAQQAKYVFYFIGDGMGVNQVNGTEMYLAECEGRIGVKPLLFTSFPVVSMATTYSVTNSVTDSAAGGTALATGSKTYNSAIGVDMEKNALQSVAERAKKSGKRVGITTSVSVTHATPAVFFGHQPNRLMYYELGLDLPKAGFDFHAGGGFLNPHTTIDKQEVPPILPILEEAGYVIARGVDEYRSKSAQADKMILIQKEGCDPASIPYAIDRKEGDLTLAQITGCAIDFLTKGSNKGFFLMVEGGKIDLACHRNDPATAFREVEDLDCAVRVAYEFYKKHPKETLIVITADHETGGLGLGNGIYELNLKALSYQTASQDGLSDAMKELRRQKKNVAWEEMRTFLGEKMGFWTKLSLTWEQERKLHDVFEETFVKNNRPSKVEPLAIAAREVMSEIAMVGWTTPAHTAGYVPVYAIGAGSKLFTGKIDNTEIPKRIAQAAGYK